MCVDLLFDYEFGRRIVMVENAILLEYYFCQSRDIKLFLGKSILCINMFYCYNVVTIMLK